MSKHTIIPQKRNDKIIPKRDQIQRIAQKQREPIIPRDDRHEQELHDIEPKPDGQERADRDVEAISKLQHVGGVAASRGSEESRASVPAR